MPCAHWQHTTLRSHLPAFGKHVRRVQKVWLCHLVIEHKALHVFANKKQ